MKTSFVFVFAVAILALANAESKIEEYLRIRKECESANPITPYIFCLHVNLGAMKINGDIDRNGLKTLLQGLPNSNSALVDDILAHCGERGGSTAAESAQALDKCIWKRFVIQAGENAETVQQKQQRFDEECRDEDAITPHLLCMHVKLGVMNSNGDIDKKGLNAALKTLPYLGIDNIVSTSGDVVADCGERRGETAADAAKALYACLKKHAAKSH